MITQFNNRSEAGKQLAQRLKGSSNLNTLVLALPRGGVQVGYEVSQALGVPLDVFLVKKMNVPGNPSFTLGAVASGGIRILNEKIIRGLGIDDAVVAIAAADAEREVKRRERWYHNQSVVRDLQDQSVLLVDDGLSSGSTMTAAVMALRARQPRKIIVATPAATPEAFAALAKLADQMVSLNPLPTGGNAREAYSHFASVSDEMVQDLLAKAAQNSCAA